MILAGQLSKGASRRAARGGVGACFLGFSRSNSEERESGREGGRGRGADLGGAVGLRGHRGAVVVAVVAVVGVFGRSAVGRAVEVA